MTTLQFKVISDIRQKDCSFPDYSRIKIQVRVNMGLYCLLCGIQEPSACLIHLKIRVSELEACPGTRRVGKHL